ncbi:FAD:protein FMN transferase [Methylobacterium nodulans]|uniref:FAD:protein FMN transferase n=1 Tax=Methylobacterium nodulans (strain LMG 21967 / CNCM I-2342 / ORS 2060) TaxID=460265 RepID=B8IJI9_METNO|nr:ApbE family lipoprotein [Methylobacterium nodulans ORS 2060]
MGSRWSAVFYSSTGDDLEGLRAAIQAAVTKVDRQMSTWDPASDLNHLNAARVGTWIDIPRELAIVLAAGIEIGCASAGAFNIAVGTLVRAWGFGSGARMPDAATIAALSGHPSLVTPNLLQVDEPGCRARKLAPLALDLSGIAKGFGVDEIARVLATAGVTAFLAGIDGELCACGIKPDGRLWAVGHEQPEPGLRSLAGVLELTDCAVATSGHYRHRRDVGGRVVSHTMDPRTGAPLSNRLASVTVLASTCMAADAWATALLVSGEIEGVRLAERLGIRALFVQSDGSLLSTLQEGSKLDLLRISGERFGWRSASRTGPG